MLHYIGTSGLTAGTEVGVLYEIIGGQRCEIRKVVRVSAAGNAWIEGSQKPFGKNGRRKVGEWRYDHLVSVEFARQRMAEQQARRKHRERLHAFQAKIVALRDRVIRHPDEFDLSTTAGRAGLSVLVNELLEPLRED